MQYGVSGERIRASSVDLVILNAVNAKPLHFFATCIRQGKPGTKGDIHADAVSAL